jgi:hypothetical protein
MVGTINMLGGLTALTSVTDADQYPIEDVSAGTTLKATGGNLRSYFNSGLVNTGADLALTQALHANRTVTTHDANGPAITLPAATGTGDVYTIFVGTTPTTPFVVITCAGSDKITGGMAMLKDSEAGTGSFFKPVSQTDTTTTLNATTTGGLIGTTATFHDVASAKWNVFVVGEASGTEATPFGT